MILVSLSRGSGASYARRKGPGQIGDRMQSGLSRKPWRAIARANSHDQGQCGFVRWGRSCTQGLALLEHGWKWWGTATSSQFWVHDCHSRHAAGMWVLTGHILALPLLGKQKSCLNTGHSLTRDHPLDILWPYLLTFPFSSLPIHSFIPLSAVVYFLLTFILSHYFLFCDDFIFSESLSSVPSFSFQMCAKGIKVFSCISCSCTRHVWPCLMSESEAWSVERGKVM